MLFSGHDDEHMTISPDPSTKVVSPSPHFDFTEAAVERTQGLSAFVRFSKEHLSHAYPRAYTSVASTSDSS
jgi:hypothetical protein